MLLVRSMFTIITIGSRVMADAYDRSLMIMALGIAKMLSCYKPRVR